MTWKRSVLVVANVTATSEQLLERAEARASESPSSFTLIVPATPFGGGRAAATRRSRTRSRTCARPGSRPTAASATPTRSSP